MRVVRWLWIVPAAFLLLLAALFVWNRIAAAELAAQQTKLNQLVAEAAAVSREAETLAAAGHYDLRAEISRRLVERVLEEFLGYRQLTRPGNRFEVESLETRFLEGHVELHARAQFHWRVGFYDGPVEITYLAFARLTPEGECLLYFRVAEVRTLAPWSVFNRWLAPLLTLRLQKNVDMPDLKLPLGLHPPAAPAAPEPARKEAQAGADRGWRFTWASRSWDVGARRVLPVVGRDGLGVLVTQAGAGAPEPSAAGVAAVESEDIRVAARVTFLSDLLTSAVLGEEDLRVSAAVLPRVWERRGKFLGQEFDNHVDLANVSGNVDITRCRALVRDGALVLDLGLAGRFTGVLEGSVFGVTASLPVKVRPVTEEALPLRIAEMEDGLALALERREVSVPLEIETSVLGQSLHFNHTLTVPPEVLARALTLPALFMTHLSVPTEIRRGAIEESKRIPVAIRWHVSVPQRDDGFLRVGGTLSFD